MAYMNQEKKALLAPGIKAVLAKYGMKGTIGVRHHSTLVVNVKSGKLDLVAEYNAFMKESHLRRWGTEWTPVDHFTVTNIRAGEGFSGKNAEFLNELVAACDVGNHDRSDSQTDYFDVGWYVDINIGN